LNSDLEDITIEGNGSELIFFKPNEYGSLINIGSCQRVLMEDFIIDWDYDKIPLASLTKIINVDINKEYYDIQFLSPHAAGKVIAGGMNPVDPNTLIVGVENVPEEGTWRVEQQQWLSPDILRWYDFYHNVGNPDMTQFYQARHYTYDMHGIFFWNLAHFVFDNVTLYSIPGIGIVGGQDSHHLGFLNCTLTIRPGSERLISATADGLHIYNSSGFIKIENCEFAYNGDDCINIHPNNSMYIRKTADPYTIIAEKKTQ